MAARPGVPGSALRVLEEALGLDLAAAGDTAEAVAAEGAFYLERAPLGSGFAGEGAPGGWRPRRSKAREDLLKTQKERDFHRMHHKRIVQEKTKLINDLKGLKLHYASYEPTIRVLQEKHHTLLKQKMLTSLERDRAVGQISGLQATLKHMEIGHNYHASATRVGPNSEKENAPEGPTQKGLHEAREKIQSKTKVKDNTKASFNRNQEGAHKLSARSTF